MTGTIETHSGRRWNGWRIGGWGFGALLLLAPAVAMQFDTGVNWTIFDFLFATVLIGLVGGALELVVRMSASWTYRAGAALALAAGFLLVWVNGAVGMIGSEDNPFNLLFGGVIAVALAGALVARFRPTGMALAMAAAAAAQACVGLAGISTDPRGGAFSIAFAGLWLLSAASFRRAGRGRTATGDVLGG